MYMLSIAMYNYHENLNKSQSHGLFLQMVEYDAWHIILIALFIDQDTDRNEFCLKSLTGCHLNFHKHIIIPGSTDEPVVI